VLAAKSTGPKVILVAEGSGKGGERGVQRKDVRVNGKVGRDLLVCGSRADRHDTDRGATSGKGGLGDVPNQPLGWFPTNANV